MRTNYCAKISQKELNKQVTICGWVNKRRDHGGVIFLDIRDITGIVQAVINPDQSEIFKLAKTIRAEYCLKITGVVNLRDENTINDIKAEKVNID